MLQFIAMITKIKTILQILYRKPQYFEDGMISIHLSNFRKDPKFVKAKQISLKRTGASEDIDWRLHVFLWAAKTCSKLNGDFIECGVNTGFLCRACVEFLDWDNLGKTMYLIDTFEGIPVELVTEKEKKINKQYLNPKGYKGTYSSVKQAFQGIDNIRIIKGKVPSCLGEVKSEKIAFMSIDMNSVVAEIGALEYFWDKIVEGGMIVLDDYGYSPKYLEQRLAIDQWASKQGVDILSVATGQGLILKSKNK